MNESLKSEINVLAVWSALVNDFQKGIKNKNYRKAAYKLALFSTEQYNGIMRSISSNKLSTNEVIDKATEFVEKSEVSDN